MSKISEVNRIYNRPFVDNSEANVALDNPGLVQWINLFLHFSVGVAPSAGLEMDIIVEKTCTVKECLKQMLDAVSLDGSGWHLRRLDWCEEVGEPLMDEEASLPDLKINNGDTLIVAEGQLPPKGFLKLSVWLCVSDSRPLTDNGFAEDCVQAVNGGDHVPVCGCGSAELREVGQVEISDEVTLDDLKTQVLTLPALSDLCVPTSAFLRLWQLEDGRLTRIIRGPQLMLRKLKLTSGTSVCIQQLFKEEDLGPKEVVLKVKMGVPGEARYYPSEELLWDASKDSSPRSLRSCLAAHYGLSPDSLLLAKFHPDKHAWDEISSWNQQVSKKKKKKRTESLLGGPFHLKDGDTVGVKNLLIDNNRDFSTLEDRLCQQRLREQAEINKRDQAAGSNCTEPKKKGGQAKSRKPEVGLSISVGEFR
ncbi:hypothetical protein WMY93_016809 [Mugilogobius chulae]|uniref:Ubiquitin carboxyl-terminal hydrolase 40 ubiquitin-like domain-containing protein n=1 Tax=Mugilogobius chulae TaxID=88201 RepID=A0AAW0NXE4_9GOBI